MTRYFEDVGAGRVVRKRDDAFELEFIARGMIWRATGPDDSYEREYYFGEGTGCLDDITPERARDILRGWGAERYFEE